MTRRQYLISAALVLTIVLAFPLCQLGINSGALFYTNGWDEASYLQYDYSKHVLEISGGGGRIAQQLVIRLHEAGISGGQINLLFDLSFTVLILWSLPFLFRLSGVSAAGSYSGSLALLGLPILFSNLNPLYDKLQSYVMSSKAVSYLAMPYINDPFWLRTPEPQFSFFILSIFLILARRSPVFYLLAPLMLFLYPFVALPAAFVAAVLFFERFGFKRAKAYITTALIISFPLLIYFKFFANSTLRGYLIPGHLPILSFSGILILPLIQNQTAALLFGSIWFALNFQIVSGFTIQPNNFEQYWSSPALFFSLLLIVNERYFKILASASMLLLLFWGIANFRQNHHYQSMFEARPGLYESLRVAPEKTAVNDIAFSTRLDMLYPRQGLTPFSYTRFYKLFPETKLPEYLCAREALAGREEFKEAIKISDELYKNGDKNYILNTIGRIRHDPPARDLSYSGPACSLNIFSITR